MRGAPRKRPPGAEAGRSTTRDTPGPHLHVKQLGRLVHPDGDCALTQGFAEHFFEGIPHLIHPTSRQSEEGPVSPGPRLAVTAPSPCTLPPECKGHRALGLVQNPALSRLSSSHDPSYVQSPVRNPVSGTRHPLLRAVPVVGAGLSHRLPASGATRAGMVTSALCKSLKGFDRRGRGGTLFTSTRASGVFPEKKGGREGALGKLLTSGPPKTVHSPAALRCMQWTTSRAQAEAPAHLPFSLLLSSREFLQSHIATASPLLRESGVRVAPATASARAPVLCAPSQATPAPAAAAPSAPPAPLDRSLASLGLAGPRLASGHDTDTAAASQPLKDKGPARQSYPANSQPTSTRFICIRAAIGLCKSACSNNLTPAAETRL